MRRILALLLSVSLLTACAPIEEPVILEHQAGGAILSIPLESDEQTEPPAPAVPVLNPSPARVQPPPALYSGGVYMYNTETDTVVFAKNEHVKYPPASIAKIMTLLVVMDNTDDLNSPVEVTREAFADFDNGDPNFDGAAIAGIEVGQTNLSYLDCLYALMLPSGCEAANILAYNAGGRSIPSFIDMMNEKALELGCLNTNFTNASGLYEENFYTTAYDMFLITKYTLDKYPMFREIYEKPFHQMPANKAYPEPYPARNVNQGLRILHDMDFAVGIKIGSIYEYFHGGVRLDGFMTLASIAEKNGLTFIIISLDADYYNEEGKWSGYHYEDHAVLYEWAYKTFEKSG